MTGTASGYYSNSALRDVYLWPSLTVSNWLEPFILGAFWDTETEKCDRVLQYTVHYRPVYGVGEGLGP